MWTFPIIEKLGGRHAVAGLIQRRRGARKSGVTPDTVRMWIARNSIPGYAVRQMIEAAERQGIETQARDFTRCEREVA